MSKPVSEQQINFINLLQAERAVPQKLVLAMREMWNAGVFSDVVADGYIQAMLRFEVNEEAVRRHSRIVGYHRFRDTVYRVYRSQNGHMYVKRLTFDANGKAKMVYANITVIKHLNEQTRMSEQAISRIESTIKNKI